MLDLQRHAIARPVTHYAPDVPKELEGIIAQLLEKDPEKRIVNATLLARRLEAMLHALSVAAEDEADQPAGANEAVSGPSGEERSEPAALAPTRVLPAPEGPPEPPSIASSYPSDLPETRVTAAFQAYAQKAAAESAAEGGRPAEGAPRGRFTLVREEELDRLEPAEAPHRALISPQTWVLAVGLVAIGLATWYFSRLPSADALYDQIRQTTADKTMASLRKAEPKIREFLERFPEDSRAGEIQKLENELDLDRRERRFELRIKGLAAEESLLPIEQNYLEAVSLGRRSPEDGIAKLQALIDLYENRTDLSGPTGQCLQLARRRLEEFQRQLARSAADHLALLQDRLDRADELARTDPARAQAIRKAVVDLYGGKAWAAEPVRRAQKALANAASAHTAPKRNP